ncbi:TIM44-like domain-containing protein [Chitinibacter bivalviorum]|uniref:TIM44-like domain-containing protein n=1 Tax=Chitinibacter bivalviorum TaxID=2739434 RepID=A0A7H9BK28_9NEIS|nr:Tim44-like domain-containing protein [Chitinibacter bivalviorum]QLG88381.1 TIM44-like domain-containing protein [Chitinibacter bivalviorum]
MARFSQTLMVVLMSTTLFASHIAEAKRIGGGRSTGMQRQAAPAPQRQAQPQQPAPMQPVPAQQKRSGMGMMGGVLGGLAAGGLLGYMLGNNASGSAQGDGGIPWGTLLLLGALTAGGVMLLRRRNTKPVAQSHAYAGVPAMNPAQAAPASQPHAFQSAPQGQDLSGGFRIGQGAGGTYSAPATPITRLPDGTDAAAFLRQARASFLHMQALNSPDQVEEMRRYMTPELFAQLKDEIGGNQDLAEFPELNLQVIEAVDEGGRMVASVEFAGRVSESLNSPAVPFKEIWHFVRPMQGDPRWLLAGIQQI